MQSQALVHAPREVIDLVRMRITDFGTSEVADLARLVADDSREATTLGLSPAARVEGEPAEQLVQALDQGLEPLRAFMARKPPDGPASPHLPAAISAAEDLQRQLDRWRHELQLGFAATPNAVADAGGGAQLLTRSESAAFLAGSRWPHTVFHRTDATGYEDLIRYPVDPAVSEPWNFTQGFWTTLTPNSTFGPRVHEIAMRIDNPLHVRSTDPLNMNWDEVGMLDAMRAAGVPVSDGMSTVDRRTALLDSGFDAVHFQRDLPFDDGGDWLIGLDAGKLRTVRADDAGIDVRLPSPAHFRTSAGHAAS